MLANIVVGSILLVHVVPLKSRIRHVLLVDAPAHLGGLEKINDALGVRIDSPKAVIYDTMRACTASYDVVWLRRVRYRVIIVEDDALCPKVRQVGY